MMNLMNKFSALTLAIAIAPALALGTTAIAANHGGMTGTEQYSGEKHAGEKHAGEKHAGKRRAHELYISARPAGSLYADDVIGKTVKHRGSGEDIGEIQDLIISDKGQVMGVVVSTGGFLGLGEKDVGLGWNHLEHAMGGDESVFYLDIDEETLRSAPEHKLD